MSKMWMDEEIHDKGLKKEIKRRKAGKTDIQLGKRGLTKGFIEEVKRRLKKNHVVKIRILRSYLRTTLEDRRMIARRVAEITGSKLLEVRGNTFILVSRGEGKNNISVRHGLKKRR